MVSPICSDRLVAFKYGLIVHIALDSYSIWSQKLRPSTILRLDYLLDSVVQVIHMEGKDEDRS